MDSEFPQSAVEQPWDEWDQLLSGIRALPPAPLPANGMEYVDELAEYEAELDEIGPYYPAIDPETGLGVTVEGAPDIDWDLPYTACDRTWYIIQHGPKGLTQPQIAALFGCSKQRVHQLEQTALAKLRKYQPGALRALLREYK